MIEMMVVKIDYRLQTYHQKPEKHQKNKDGTSYYDKSKHT